MIEVVDLKPSGGGSNMAIELSKEEELLILEVRRKGFERKQIEFGDAVQEKFKEGIIGSVTQILKDSNFSAERLEHSIKEALNRISSHGEEVITRIIQVLKDSELPMEELEEITKDALFRIPSYRVLSQNRQKPYEHKTYDGKPIDLEHDRHLRDRETASEFSDRCFKEGIDFTK